MRARRPGMSVIIATAYMEEAERFDWLIAMNAGKVLAVGSPGGVQGTRPARRSLEDAFIALLPEQRARSKARLQFRRARRTIARSPSWRAT